MRTGLRTICLAFLLGGLGGCSVENATAEKPETKLPPGTLTSTALEAEFPYDGGRYVVVNEWDESKIRSTDKTRVTYHPDTGAEFFYEIAATPQPDYWGYPHVGRYSSKDNPPAVDPIFPVRIDGASQVFMDFTWWKKDLKGAYQVAIDAWVGDAGVWPQRGEVFVLLEGNWPPESGYQDATIDGVEWKWKVINKSPVEIIFFPKAGWVTSMTALNVTKLAEFAAGQGIWKTSDTISSAKLGIEPYTGCAWTGTKTASGIFGVSKFSVYLSN